MLNKVKKMLVYNFGEKEPWGMCDGVVTLDGKSISEICVRSLSLIPTCRAVRLSDIAEVNDKSIVLKKGCGISGVISKNVIRANVPIVRAEDVKEKKHRTKLNSLCFDTENGEITDITVLGSPSLKKKKISINKIWVKENTIYIE